MHHNFCTNVSTTIPATIYLFKVNYGNSRTMYKICSKLTIKTPERRQKDHAFFTKLHLKAAGLFMYNFLDVVLVPLLLTLLLTDFTYSFSIVDFEQL